MDGYNKSLRAYFETLQQTQWLPKNELDAHQRLQLQHILLHAFRTAPFYRERLAPVIRADGNIDFSCWHEIPVTKRAHLQDHQEEMWSTDVPARHGYISVNSTSGSTGVPVKMKWANISGVARRAAMWRMYEWHGFEYSADHAITLGDHPWPEGGVGGHWGPPWLDRAGTLLSIVSTTPYTRIAEWIGRKRPKYFSAVPLVHSAVAEAMVDQKIDNPLACMLAYGAQVTPLCRSVIGTTLGIPIIEMYSSQECGHIAHECEAGSLHLLSELVLVEILDEDDKPCPPGIEGRVVVTVLHNTAQPTIRYELGDIAATASSCRCGRTLPVISPIAGRLKHMFQFAGGQRVVPSDGRAYRILAPYLDPSWYQIAQTGPMAVEIRFVSKRKPDDQSLHRLRREIPKIWRHAEPEIIFRQLDAPPDQPGRKHVVFVNEWNPQITPR